MVLVLREIIGKRQIGRKRKRDLENTDCRVLETELRTVWSCASGTEHNCNVCHTLHMSLLFFFFSLPFSSSTILHNLNLYSSNFAPVFFTRFTLVIVLLYLYQYLLLTLCLRICFSTQVCLGFTHSFYYGIILFHIFPYNI